MLEYLARGVIEPGALVGCGGVGRRLAPRCSSSRRRSSIGIAWWRAPTGSETRSERYAATGIDELAVSIFAAPEEQPAIVEQLARARPAHAETT